MKITVSAIELLPGDVYRKRHVTAVKPYTKHVIVEFLEAEHYEHSAIFVNEALLEVERNVERIEQ